LEALEREIFEETGMHTGSFLFQENFSFTVRYQDDTNVPCELYHIALIYFVGSMDGNQLNDSIVREDVRGSLWMPIKQLCKQNSSPLVLRAVGI
jgi:ADP-ribose pyrophosphatase YjhB (NUDIX family)